MSSNSKTPKTFIIYIKNKDKEGYLRFKSHQKNTMDIIFLIEIEKKIKNASVFVNMDNAKKIAHDLEKKYNDFDEIGIIDMKTMKVNYVKKENKKSKLK